VSVVWSLGTDQGPKPGPQPGTFCYTLSSHSIGNGKAGPAWKAACLGCQDAALLKLSHTENATAS